MNKITKEKFLQRVEEKGITKFDLSNIKFIDNYTPLQVKCNDCGSIIFKRPREILINQDCKICNKMAKWKDNETFINELKEIFGDKFDYSEVDYRGSRSQIKLKCNICGRIDFHRASHLLGGHGCIYCGGKLQLTTEEFIKKANEVHNNEYNYDRVNYVNNKTNIEIYHPKCGNYFLQKPSNHLQGKGCLICYGSIRKTNEEFIKEAIELFGDTDFDYSNVNYKNGNTKVKIFCKICKTYFEIKPSMFLLRGHNHNRSMGELQIARYLDSKNIMYKREYRFKECKDIKLLPFDFYLSDYNTVIEFQGEQHYRTVGSYFNGEEGLKSRQHYDQIKRDYCKANNITELEIRYDEKVNEVLDRFFEEHSPKSTFISPMQRLLHPNL